MTTNELKNLISSGAIAQIVFYGTYKNEDSEKLQWSILARDHEGQNTVFKFGGFLINSSRDKKQKQYTSLDRAYSAIKELGYEGAIEIDS